MTDEIKACRMQVARAAVISLIAGAVAVGIAYAIAKATGKPQLAADIAMAGGLLLLAGLPGLVLSVALTGRVRGEPRSASSRGWRCGCRSVASWRYMA